MGEMFSFWSLYDHNRDDKRVMGIKFNIVIMEEEKGGAGVCVWPESDEESTIRVWIFICYYRSTRKAD